MNGYVCFYKNQRVEVYANTTLEAQLKVAELLKIKPKHQGNISAILAEKDGVEVCHDPAILGS